MDIGSICLSCGEILDTNGPHELYKGHPIHSTAKCIQDAVRAVLEYDRAPRCKVCQRRILKYMPWRAHEYGAQLDGQHYHATEPCKSEAERLIAEEIARRMDTDKATAILRAYIERHGDTDQVDEALQWLIELAQEWDEHECDY